MVAMHAQPPSHVVHDLAGGNSFNQLAVLATYSEAHLQAVCHYFRSLAVAHPFQVARENLLLLFDQARAKYESLPASQAAGTPPLKGRGRASKAAAQKPRVPIAQLLPVMAVRFAHAHGMPICPSTLQASSVRSLYACLLLCHVVGEAQETPYMAVLLASRLMFPCKGTAPLDHAVASPCRRAVLQDQSGQLQ